MDPGRKHISRRRAHIAFKAIQLGGQSIYQILDFGTHGEKSLQRKRIEEAAAHLALSVLKFPHEPRVQLVEVQHD